MLKNNNKLVFHKLIAEIGEDFVTRTIEEYNGDYRSQHFDTRSHINSMLYLNIKNCKSLRELESELSSNRKTKSLINVPSVSQFSRKNSSRDYRIFEDIFYHLVKKAKRRFGAVRLLKDIAPIKIYDCKWYDRLTEQGIKFVTRGIKNAIIMKERILESKPLKDIYDTEVVLGSTPGGNLTFSNYREIMTFDENGEPVTFVTNIFDLSTEDVISIYKHRWEIELFFKWIKQNLRIKKYICYNENAIKMQLFSALIAYMLIYLCCSINVAKYSMLTLTRIVRSNLLEVIDIA